MYEKGNNISPFYVRFWLQEKLDEHGQGKWEGKQKGKSDNWQEDHGIQSTAKGKHYIVHKPSRLN
jgi:hypothetical protein